MRNNFWTEEENKIIIDLFDRRQELSYKKIQNALYKATGLERSYNSIFHQMSKLGLSFINKGNNDLKNDYYHISEFRRFGFGSTIRIKNVLEEAGIKVYRRSRYFMVHCEDIENAEKTIKTYLKKTSKHLTKKYKSKRSLCEKFFLSTYELDKIINKGIIKADLTVNNYHCFSQEEENKLKEYLDNLNSEYYSAKELSSILGINYSSIFPLIDKHKLKTTTSSKSILFKKSDCTKIIKYKNFITNECVWIQEVVKKIKYAESHIRKLFKDNNIPIYKWKNKSFITTKKFELFVNIITNKDKQK